MRCRRLVVASVLCARSIVRSKRLFSIGLLLLLLPVSALAKEVVVLLDPNIRPYVEALAGFKSTSDANTRIFARKEDGDLSDERAMIGAIRARKPDQILVIGSEAMRALAGEVTDIPILFVMVLNPRDRLKVMPGNMTGVSMSVAPERQMKVLSQLLPEVKRVAVVYDPEQSQDLINRGKKACLSVNQQLFAREVGSPAEAVEQAKLLLSENHTAYWMIPDQLMRARDVVRYLFFTAREQNRPLIGLSDKYVRAGALFAFTVQNETLGQQVAELSNRMLAEGKKGHHPIEMARDADLSINLKVASEMGITVPEVLLRQAKVIN
nr:ABC transporter substrate binding protein [Mariprofundus sp. KV]